MFAAIVPRTSDLGGSLLFPGRLLRRRSRLLLGLFGLFRQPESPQTSGLGLLGNLRRTLGFHGSCRIDPAQFPDVADSAHWPKAKAILAETFAQRSRQDWCELLEGSDACFAPVLSAEEAPDHPHNRARQTFVEIDNVMQPAPGPRFSRTSPPLPRSSQQCRGDTGDLLAA